MESERTVTLSATATQMTQGAINEAVIINTPHELSEVSAMGFSIKASDALTLESVIRRAYASEINVGLQSFWDAGFHVWIGDDVNGLQAQDNFAVEDLADVPAWIDEAIRRIYSDSDYAEGLV